MQWLQSLLGCGALALSGPGWATPPGPGGLAATETWTVAAVHRVPTRAPDARFDALRGTTWTVRAGRTMRLGPWDCMRARHRFVMLPAAGLFQGLGADAALATALSLDTVPMPVPTQRIDCDNASLDLHRLHTGRAVLALDGFRIELAAAAPPVPDEPEAIVQALLLAHLGDRVHWRAEDLQAYAGWLSPGLLRAMRRWFERPQDGQDAPYLDGDPFTDVQEPPEGFVLRRVERQGEGAAARARVRVAIATEGRPPHLVTFHLRREAGGWRIDDIALRDGTRVRALMARDERAAARPGR